MREKFQSLAGRMNKRKSAVAVARKLVTLAWLLMRRREYYNGIDPDTLKKKLKYYKVRGRDGGLLPDLTVRAPMVRENQKKSIFS